MSVGDEGNGTFPGYVEQQVLKKQNETEGVIVLSPIFTDELEGLTWRLVESCEFVYYKR